MESGEFEKAHLFRNYSFGIEVVSGLYTSLGRDRFIIFDKRFVGKDKKRGKRLFGDFLAEGGKWRELIQRKI